MSLNILDLYFSKKSSFISISTATNLDKSHVGNILYVTAGAILTIQTNAIESLDIGSEIVIISGTASDVTIAGAGGVTLNSKDSNKKINGQYSAVTLIKKDTDEWLLVGDLKA